MKPIPSRAMGSTAMDHGSYLPESYWSRVATEIRKRGRDNCLAGDDNPFFRYRRQRFLTQFLSTMDFDSKVVLEVGPGRQPPSNRSDYPRKTSNWSRYLK